MTVRDWRAGELRLLAMALVVAVASVTSVGFLADRIRQALERDAAQLLGGDLVLNADAPVSDAQRAEARRLGLSVTETLQFPSMATAGSGDTARSQLSALKAVSPGYPLRGALQVAEGPGRPGAPTAEVPAPGTVWVDAQLLSLLDVEVGGQLQLGDRRFRIERVITVEPDRGMNFINVAPRVMIRMDDLDGTGLVTFGSRVTYRLLVAGPQGAVRDYAAWLRAHPERGQRVETLDSGRPEMRRTIDRAHQFLSLVALLAALIAAVAVALAARRFTLRHFDSVAVMRCLGATQSMLTWLFAAEFFFIALGAAALGSALGYAAHEGLIAALGELITSDLPSAGPLPAIQGFLAGIWLLLGFALPPLARLRHVSPVRVLRRDTGIGQTRIAVGYGIGALGFALLLLWFARDLKLGLMVAGGFLGGFLIFSAAAWLGIRWLEPLRQWQRGPVALRFALAGVVRRQGATVAQICALAVGLMALLLLSVTRSDLVDGWRQAAPPDAPNRFLINIQPDQREAVSRRLAQAGLGQVDLYPMIRGRLIEINGRAVGPADYQDGRARRLVDREFNLSYMERMPGHNRPVAGRWLDPARAEVSMEEGIAQTLGVHVGDTLKFDVAGNPVEARVSGLRAVDWDSMQVNFFAILSPAALRDMPQSWITALHLPPDKGELSSSLIREFPNLTIFDTSAILRQVQGVLDQVVAAVQFLFLFTLAAGCLVLYAALASTRDERVREAGLLRALGATRRQLSIAQWLELAVIGAAAGLFAAAGASVVAWLLARFVFNFALAPNPWVWGAGLLVGVACAWIGGWMGLRGVLRHPPLATLRDA
ncbi:MAG: FtsX-like permease family protein [Pigmentiphaga sp.]|uniref:ABC transporter permease n=1 Tax=Pigmentiphaga sp. TaxID=1977564 RepID=UPI0029A24999|nr:FtsX-like permease family protein [Pigmentiphaga sp.]MDX3907196.1 FtsX-like permease family protein [Pigmentiphaga sp.]